MGPNLKSVKQWKKGEGMQSNSGSIYTLCIVSTSYVSKISLIKVSTFMYTNMGLFSREILGCYQISGGFSDEILWGIHTGLLNIREYGNNGSNSGIYSVIRPSLFCAFLS